jgi:hypothetical protein
MQEVQGQLARLDPRELLLVLEHHVVDTALVRGAGLAEGHLVAGDALQFQHHVLEHVAQPGPLVLEHATDQAAGLAVGAAVLRQSRQRVHQRIDEFTADARRRPLLEHAEIHRVANDREQGIDVGTTVDTGVNELHVRAPPPGKAPLYRQGAA